MRTAVTGKKGQIVQSLFRHPGRNGTGIIALGRPELDLSDPSTIIQTLQLARPDVVVSAAAYTAVDRAESEPDYAFVINSIGAGAVAEAAAQLDVPIIHISTDYVFSGDKPTPYIETDITDPLSVYGSSKLEGEHRVAAANANHVILRTSWVYSPFGNNFMKTMLRLAETQDELRVVSDQLGCPTSALDIADAIVTIAERLRSDPDPALRGTYHLSGSGEASWADFAREIFAKSKALGGPFASVFPIATAEYPTPAKRPANSRLCCEKLAATFGIWMPVWESSTQKSLQHILT